MKKELYIIKDEDVDAIFDTDINLVYVNDKLHNGNLDLSLISALGYNYFELYHDEFIKEDEYEEPSLSNEIANLSLLKERLKEWRDKC